MDGSNTYQVPPNEVTQMKKHILSFSYVQCTWRISGEGRSASTPHCCSRFSTSAIACSISPTVAVPNGVFVDPVVLFVAFSISSSNCLLQAHPSSHWSKSVVSDPVAPNCPTTCQKVSINSSHYWQIVGLRCTHVRINRVFAHRAGLVRPAKPRGTRAGKQIDGTVTQP